LKDQGGGFSRDLEGLGEGGGINAVARVRAFAELRLERSEEGEGVGK
jgi:hypothetical protein